MEFCNLYRYDIVIFSKILITSLPLAHISLQRATKEGVLKNSDQHISKSFKDSDETTNYNKRE